MEAVLVIAAACGIFIFLWLGRDKGSYLYHNSGAKRVCVDCGQVQHLYRFDIWGDTWWEVVDEMKNPKCKCHKDTK